MKKKTNLRRRIERSRASELAFEATGRREESARCRLALDILNGRPGGFVVNVFAAASPDALLSFLRVLERGANVTRRPSGSRLGKNVLLFSTQQGKEIRLTVSAKGRRYLLAELEKSGAVIKEVEPERVTDEAGARLQVARGRDPRRFPWGLHYSDYGESFFWFKTPDDMISGLYDCVLLVYPSTAEEFRDDLRKAYFQSRKPLQALAELLPDPCGIGWCGKIGELRSGKTSYALNLRADFWREEQEREQSELEAEPKRRVSPIPKKKFSAFCAYIRGMSGG